MLKMNKLTLAVLLLWLATIAAFVWFFVRGNVSPGTEHRMAVTLAPAEREMVLAEMRGLLAGVHDILDGINRNDMRQVASAAHRVGMASAADVNPALMTKLPLPFKQLGMSVHHGMDDLADAAQNGRPAAEVQVMLTDTLEKCVACHSTWQLKASGERSQP